MGDPVEERLRQDEERPAAAQALLATIGSYREAALSKDSKYDHIETGDKEKVGTHFRSKWWSQVP